MPNISGVTVFQGVPIGGYRRTELHTDDKYDGKPACFTYTEWSSFNAYD